MGQDIWPVEIASPIHPTVFTSAQSETIPSKEGGTMTFVGADLGLAKAFPPPDPKALSLEPERLRGLPRGNLESGQ